MITFDNQLSTGIQAFGHCGSPTCSMTSAFGANPETSVGKTSTSEPNLIKGIVYIGLGFLFLEVFILGGKVLTSRLT
jgi:hypothetical protein